MTPPHPDVTLRRLDLLGKAEYTAAELARVWRTSPHVTRTQLLLLLREGSLHVTCTDPVRYSRVKPEQVTLAGELLTHYARLPEQFMRSDAQRHTGLGVPATAMLITQLLNMGRLHPVERGYYSKTVPNLLTPEAPRRGVIRHRTEQHERLREERLLSVHWPARLSQVKATWNISTNATNAYLLRLVRGGWLRVHEGVYHLPHQPTPPRSSFPVSRGRRKKETPPLAGITPLVQHRFESVPWPATPATAALIWNLSVHAAAFTLQRLVDFGLLRESGGTYDVPFPDTLNAQQGDGDHAPLRA